MKLGLKLFGSLLLALVVLVSCSEDSTNEPTNTDNYSKYVPMTVGSYWVYENWNTNDSWVGDSLATRDSVVVVAETNLFGKTAMMLVTFNTENGEATDTTYQNYSNSKLYTIEKENPYFGQNTWLEAIDFTSNGKTIVDTTLTDVVIDGGSFTGDINYSYVKGANKSVNLKSTNYNAMTLDYSGMFDGTFNVGFLLPVTSTMNNTTYFVENIGRVQTLNKIVTSTMGQNVTAYTKEILVDWKIK